MKLRVITARINNDIQYQIAFLKSSLRLPNTTSVLTYAIHTLYESLKEEQATKSSLELFEEQGLLGCLEGASDLSTRYKNEISELIEKKHHVQRGPHKKKATLKRSTTKRKS